MKKKRSIRTNPFIRATSRLFDPSGMSLIEVLIAMGITSIAFLGVTSLVMSVTMGNRSSNIRTVATVLAQDGLDKVVNAGFTDTASTVTEGYNSINVAGTGYPSYKRVTAIANTSQPNVKKVTVSVFGENDAQSVVAHTLLAK